MEYQTAWDYQEKLLKENVRRKSLVYNQKEEVQNDGITDLPLLTEHHLLFVEHPPVYTLGKSGNKENILIDANSILQLRLLVYK